MVSKSSKGLFCLIFLTVCVHFSHEKRDYYFKLNTCDARSVDPKGVDVNCTVMPNGKINTITGFLTIFKMAEKFGAGGQILVRPLKGGLYMTLFNQTFPDLCPFLVSKNLPNLAQIAMDSATKQGKIPRCPVQEGLYYVKDYYLSPELFPPHAPEAEFKIKGHFSTTRNGKYRHSAEWAVEGSVEMTRNNFWNRNKQKD